MTNGAKVYVVARSEAVHKVAEELNQLGRESGGSAIGYGCNQDKSSTERRLKPETSLLGISAICQTRMPYHNLRKR